MPSTAWTVALLALVAVAANVAALGVWRGDLPGRPRRIYPVLAVLWVAAIAALATMMTSPSALTVALTAVVTATAGVLTGRVAASR